MSITRKARLRILAFALTIVVAAPHVVFAQQGAETHTPNSQTRPAHNSELKDEIQALRQKVAQLEAALSLQHQSRYGTDGAISDSSAASSNKIGDMGMHMGMMDAMKRMSQDSSAMPQAMDMPSGRMDRMGMGMMNQMGMMGRNPAMNGSNMSGMSMPSSLPGFPGASHLYHIGETGFFLEHEEHINLSEAQQKQLNEIKEAALLARATAERKIEEAEQEMWQLTAMAEPDIKKIEAKANEIAQIEVSHRLAFIRSVGMAANVLSDEQRQKLVGNSQR